MRRCCALLFSIKFAKRNSAIIGKPSLVRNSKSNRSLQMVEVLQLQRETPKSRETYRRKKLQVAAPAGQFADNLEVGGI